ncbi:hypothetical protein BJY24_006592 [Nocardia transvalensis]|uniref:Uncharacterized protein n=1 Tax=Nocardia transvalensis TaxID=37333 RepID=A0A7W9PKR9_9NOCA|nr:hypothetical protein [Nocardia transvalensis]
MAGDGVRVVLVQAQQVAADRGFQFTGLDVLGQFGLVRAPFAAIGRATPSELGTLAAAMAVRTPVAIRASAAVPAVAVARAAVGSATVLVGTPVVAATESAALAVVASEVSFVALGT